MSRRSTGSSSRSEDDRAKVRSALASAGVRPRRELGQSFLVDPFVADAEAALAGVPPGRPVLEIGPGTGTLTEALLRRGLGPLTVLEVDPRLAAGLRRGFGDRIRVLEGDARTAPLPPADVVVGNLPFSVATPVLVRLLKARVPRIVALLQAEVADRLLARPGGGEYGRLTLLAHLYAEVEGFQRVPAAAFEPVPSVDGRIVTLASREGPLPVPDVDRFESITAALFSGRRKQLRNLLPRVVPPGEDAGAIAGAAGWPSDWERRRPEELPPEAYVRLAVALGRRPGGAERPPAPRPERRVPRAKPG